MSTINDEIVREYFEMLGYLVIQPCKYSVPGRQKRAEEEVDLVVFNPLVKEHKSPENFVLTTQDLRNVARAVIAVRGWHTERFYLSTFEHAPDILRFLEAEPVRFASKVLGSNEMAKILCLPNLPASGELRQKTIQALRDKGLDGVISFETILAELVDGIDANKNYEKSDLLQMIRLLKRYDLIRHRQLEMFTKVRRRRTRVKAQPAHPAPEVSGT